MAPNRPDDCLYRMVNTVDPHQDGPPDHQAAHHAGDRKHRYRRGQSKPEARRQGSKQGLIAPDQQVVTSWKHAVHQTWRVSFPDRLTADRIPRARVEPPPATQTGCRRAGAMLSR